MTPNYHPESCTVAGGGRASEVLRDGTPRRDRRDPHRQGRLLLVNTVPVLAQQQREIIGAISTFRGVKQKFRQLMQRWLLDGMRYCELRGCAP